jgi:DNA-binding NarL/FixJ family response regulator
VSQIRVAVVDDHPLFRDGVTHMLSREEDIFVVGQGGTADDAVQIAGELRPDIIVLDMNMPGNGVTAVAKIHEMYPEVRVLVLSVVIEEDQVYEAMRKGARGYLLKGSGADELVRTTRLIHRGEIYVSATLAGHLLATGGQNSAETVPEPVVRSELSTPSLNVSPRQKQILSRIALGLSNKEIAAQLDLTETTVKHYITGLLSKLQVRNRTEAALLLRQGRNGPSDAPD